MSDPRPPADAEPWGAEGVRRLRTHLGETQAGLADRLGTRQQTVSEWETGASTPRRMSRRLLHLVAEASGFYTVDAAVSGGDPPEASP
ncbi:MAG: helix-turn-helix domain-containing protein [Dehalococcoidia bacterium]|nr:helix-turn-helix domain-containing protein [Dehalococcoidia bacterium]